MSSSTAIAFDASEVSLEPGVALVEASAGTGKTYSITQLVLRLLFARRPDHTYRVRGLGSILVVTFTNAATDELITRVRAILRAATDVFAGTVEQSAENADLFALRDIVGSEGLPRLLAALADLDELAVFTIHGFCRRVLEENALESGTPFGARFLEDDGLLRERIAEDWWRRTMYEDATLAELAVQSGWTHDVFLEDLAKWQRLPDTEIDPDISMAAARRDVSAAVQQLATVWNASAARDFIAARKWNGKSPFKSEDKREELLAKVAALLAGHANLAGQVAAAFSTGAMMDAADGMSKRDRDRYQAATPEPFVRAMDGLADAVLGFRVAVRVFCMRDVQQRFDSEKRRRHLLGFDDLLRNLRDALVAEGPDGHLARAIRARYDAALIDEFQDTDPFQFPIFATAFADRPLFLIGDPKQAIYSFRGADLHAYLAAVASAGEHYTLARNWRSTPRMVAAVNALFSFRSDAFLHSAIAFTPVAAAREPHDSVQHDGLGALHWWLLEQDEHGSTQQLNKGDAMDLVTRQLVREVVRLLTPDTHGQALRAGQIAILVRSKYQGVAFQRALRRARVPSIVAGMDDILLSDELRDLEWIMTAILSPGRAGIVRAALATELWGYSAHDIARLALPEHDDEWQARVDQLTGWRDEWHRHGFMRMIQRVLTELGVQRLLALENGDRRLTNFRHAVELLQEATADEQLSPEALLPWIARTRDQKKVSSERTELRLESDADAVQISTIHKAKGLEYDVVFCPTLWATRRDKADEPVLVHEDGRVVFDHGSDRRTERGALADAEALAEELRLVYVALTRARFRCYVAWGAVVPKNGAHFGHTALGYLLRQSTDPRSAIEHCAEVPTEWTRSTAQAAKPVQALVEANAGSMSMESVVADEDPLPRLAIDATDIFVPKWREWHPAHDRLQSWRMTSFTSLASGSHTDDARDIGDAGTHDATPFIDSPRDFLSFPSGRIPGIALHELFERIDFCATREELTVLSREILPRMALLDHPERVDAVVGMAEQVLGCPLPGAGFALRDVPRRKTLREWAFQLPLGVIESGTLARVFSEHGGALGQRYAPALRTIGAERVQGFLTGVVDLAFEHRGRWHVVDWKSNHLGTDPASYEPAALERAMIGSHYILQYHLYITALHRFLRARVPGYTYETHVAGAWYAFLRGVDGTERGWFRDRPPLALIRALDEVMGAVPEFVSA